MGELFTRAEVKRHMAEEVAACGGARKWLRKHPHAGNWSHAMHMIENGDAAFAQAGILDILGFKRVERFEAINPDIGK
jgi:hypothetical protein